MSNLLTIKGVRGYIDENGTAQLNLEDVAQGLGIVKTDVKEGKEYVRIHKQNLKSWLVSFGLVKSEEQLPEFIPENIFYRLAMKAQNETAKKFQIIVADEILPAIRRTGTYSVNPLLKPRKTTTRIRPAVKDALDTAEYIASKLGVKLGIAQAAAISMVEQNSDIKLGQLKGLLPPAEHETGHLNATNLGKLIGSSAVDTNRLLVDKNLQYQGTNAKGDKYYRLTDAGKEYGEEFPYERNGHCGYQIKWNESVVSIL